MDSCDGCDHWVASHDVVTGKCMARVQEVDEDEKYCSCQRRVSK